MKGLFKKTTTILLVLVLAGMFGAGCGGGGDDGKPTIVIGEITDLTGICGPVLTPLHYAVDAMIRYYNEEGLIPGVELQLVTYDTRWDAARDIPGYNWLKERGADIIIAVPSTTILTMNSFLEEDGIVVASMTTLHEVCDPPGSTFCFSNSSADHVKTLLKWINENDWDYTDGTPKIGVIGTPDAFNVQSIEATEEYIEDHPGHFDYEGSFQPPNGTVLYAGEVEQLKDCDYVLCLGTESVHFVDQYVEAGYDAQFINVNDGACWKGMWTEMCGWDVYDGFLTTSASLSWDQSTPIVDLGEELLYEYYPGEADNIIETGATYIGSCQQMISILDVLRAAIEEVGVENFGAQAYYDAAEEYSTTGEMWDGYYPEWGFSETKRYLVDDVVIYEFSAEVEDLVRVTDWLPLVIE